MKKVEDEWERELEADDDLDLLFISYDKDRITIEKIQAVIKQHGFQAEIRKDQPKPAE